MAKKRVFVFLADGFEEVEAATPIDYLRRAGLDVVAVAVTAQQGMPVRGAHGLMFKADAAIDAIDADSGAALVLPGGMPGATNLAASAALDDIIKTYAASGKLIAAICASPAVVLAPKGILAGKDFTCYPGMEGAVTGAVWKGDRVVVAGNVITSRGPGTAAAFALAIIEQLAGAGIAKKVACDALV